MRKIDVHNHFYPDVYIKEIQRDSRIARIVEDDETRIYYAGDYSVLDEGHRNPARRIEDMDRAGVDVQVLSLTVPGVHYEEPARGIELARLTNDAFAEVCQAYPDRFQAFATLPTQDPRAAAVELERAVSDLNLTGAMIFSNLDGSPLDDEQFWPVYEVADSLRAPLLVHPISPPSLQNLDEMRLVALLGFPLEMTLAATRLVLGGVLDRFPNVPFIMGQLGGALPMLAERVEHGYHVYPELASKLKRSPTEYFQAMYYDTVPYGKRGIPLTYEFAGPERILLASDYPHQIGSLEDCALVIEGLDVSEADKALMLGGNAERVFGLANG